MTHWVDTLSRADDPVSAGRCRSVDTDTSTQALLAAAAFGDQTAWDRLVDRFDRLVW
jgi:hypothetical protein